MTAPISVRAAGLMVRWDDNSLNESGFKIERTSDGSSFEEIAIVGPNVTEYLDTTPSTPNAYWYRVRAFNSGGQSAYSNVSGSVTGDTEKLAALSTGSPRSGSLRSRLINLSVRATAGTGEDSLIVGFVVGFGQQSVLVRGVGPGLAPYTTAAVEVNPTLSVRSDGVLMLENDDWDGSARLSNLFSQVGAFPLSPLSRDAALSSDFDARSYTVLLDGTGSGIAMTEIYDAAATTSAGRLLNLSARARTGTGDAVLIAGFVIAGTQPMRVLVRAVGPSLRTYGVTTAVPDPQLDLFRGTVPWDHNDNWSGDLRLDQAFLQAGAFRLPDAASKDAAVAVLLPPGAYTAIVSGAYGATGVALAEVYELP